MNTNEVMRIFLSKKYHPQFAEQWSKGEFRVFVPDRKGDSVLDKRLENTGLVSRGYGYDSEHELFYVVVAEIK